ncbi:MOSC domain-containing protein [Roseinatronobacter sp. NSM]|uniref:MOSC domain-containing protein n=1 Tax=Roseinatronobacter sp. NSM TaxID=3457785 RepID=UPI004036474B
MGWRLAHIFRHPIKAHGRQSLDDVALTEGRCLPFDRHWAVAHEAARLQDGWNPCMNFTRAAKTPALQAIDAQFDETAGRITLTHPARDALTFDPDTAHGQVDFLNWVAPLMAGGRAQPVRLVTAGRGMTDTDFESVSLLNLASNRVLGARLGCDLGLDRWRGNLWLDGLAPWEEFDLLDRELAIGDARLKIVERITRCRATMVDCATGRIDVDTLAELDAAYGHTDFGVYAIVTRGGIIRTGDRLELCA